MSKMNTKKKSNLGNVSVSDFNLSKWIDTPFAYTHAFVGRSVQRGANNISSGLSLLQQQVLILVASNFKRNMEEYYRSIRNTPGKGRELYLPLFTEESVKDDICGFYNIPLSEINMTSKNVSIQKDIVDQLKNLSLYVPSDEPDAYFDVVIFSAFHINPRKRTLDVKLNHEVVKYLLNMNEGYIHHIKAIAETSKKKYTPMFYFYMLHLLKGEDKCTVIRPLDELRRYLGLVTYKDGTMEIEKRMYPAFSDFRLKVIEPCQQDLASLARQFKADILFKVEAVYDKPGKTRGNPENLKYTIERNLYGKLANDVRKGKKDVTKAVQTLQGCIVESIEVKHKSAVKKPKVEIGVGQDKWNEFTSLVIEPSEKSLISRVRFVGMMDKRFCVECSDEDFGLLLSKNGVGKIAREYFGCQNSLVPVFFRV